MAECIIGIPVWKLRHKGGQILDLLLPLMPRQQPKVKGVLLKIATRQAQGSSLIINFVPTEELKRLERETDDGINRLKRDRNCITTWQIREPRKRRYGGAVIAGPDGQFLFACAGLHEKGNDAFVILLTYYLHLNDWTLANGLASISGNGYWLKLFDEVRRMRG